MKTSTEYKHKTCDSPVYMSDLKLGIDEEILINSIYEGAYGDQMIRTEVIL